MKSLSKFSEREILQLHGIGKTTIPVLRKALNAEALSFKKIEETTKSADSKSVDAYIKKCNHPLLNIVKALRIIILSADKSIGEEIAWNAPSFFYSGKMRPFHPKEYKRLIINFNLFRDDCIRLIFLTGSSI